MFDPIRAQALSVQIFDADMYKAATFARKVDEHNLI